MPDAFRPFLIVDVLNARVVRWHQLNASTHECLAHGVITAIRLHHRYIRAGFGQHQCVWEETLGRLRGSLNNLNRVLEDHTTRHENECSTAQVGLMNPREYVR